MVKLLVWLIKLPFMLVALVLTFMFGLVGVILSLLSVALASVLGVGLAILPFGLVFLLLAWLIAQLFSNHTTTVTQR